MTGGIQGGVEAKAQASLSLELKKGVFTGTMNPATLGLDLVARIFFSTSPAIPKWLLEYVPEYVDGVEVKNGSLYYKIGQINIFIAKTPSYSLSFDMRKGQFNYLGAKGQYSAVLNPEIKAALKEVKDGIVEAAEWCNKNLNPLEWAKAGVEWVGDVAEDVGLSLIHI